MDPSSSSSASASSSSSSRLNLGASAYHPPSSSPSPSPSSSSSSSASSSSQPINTDQKSSGLGLFKSETPTKSRLQMTAEENGYDREVNQPTNTLPSTSPALADSSPTSISVKRPKTLNRLQSRGLTLSIPSSSSQPTDPILNSQQISQPQTQPQPQPPSTPSSYSSNHPSTSTEPIDTTKKPRKRPIKLSLKPIGTNHDLSKSVPNSPLDSNLSAAAPVGKSSIAILNHNHVPNRNPYYQESKDLRDTLRGTPRRRPSMPFATKTLNQASRDPTSNPSDAIAPGQSEISTPLSSHPSARRPEAYRDPSEHILSGRGSTLQHARSVYASGPVEVLPGVWLGDEFNARDEESLMDLNIKTILNVSKETVLPFQEDDRCQSMKVRRRDANGRMIYSFKESKSLRDGLKSSTGREVRLGMSRENSKDRELTTKIGIPSSSSSKTITDSRRNSRNLSEYRSPDESGLKPDDQDQPAPSPLIDDFFTPPTTANPLSTNGLSFSSHLNSNLYLSFSSQQSDQSIAVSAHSDSQTIDIPSALNISDDLDSPPHYLRNTSSTPNLQLSYHTPLTSARNDYDEESGKLSTPRNGSSDSRNYMSEIQEQNLRGSSSARDSLSGKGREGSASSSENSWIRNDACRLDDEIEKEIQESYRSDLENETDQTSSTTSNSTARTSINDSESGHSSISSSSLPTELLKRNNPNPHQDQHLEIPTELESNSMNSTPTIDRKKRNHEGEHQQNLGDDQSEESRLKNIEGTSPNRNKDLGLESKVILPLNAIALNVPASPLQGRVNPIRYIKLPWTHDEVSLASSNGGGFQLGCEIIAEAIGLRDALENDSFQEDHQAEEDLVPQTPSTSNPNHHQQQRIISTPKPDPNKGGVLVHCQCGVSRSATLVIAFVMQAAALGYGFETTKDLTGMHDCYSFVKEKSSTISPNCSLIYQLVEWERHLSSEASRLRALLGVTSDNSDPSNSDPQSLNQDANGTNSNPNPSNAAGSKLKWAVETMDEEEWTRMRREEEMKDAEEQEREKIKRLEEAKRLMQEKKKREEEELERERENETSTTLGGVGIGGLGARRKKKTPSLLLGGPPSASNSTNQKDSGLQLGQAPLKSARPKLGLNPSSLAKPLKNLTLDSASESEENEIEGNHPEEKLEDKEESERRRIKDEEEQDEERKKKQAREESRAQLEFGSPSKKGASASSPSPTHSRKPNSLINPRPLSTSSISTPRLINRSDTHDLNRGRDNSKVRDSAASVPSTSQSLSSIPTSNVESYSVGVIPTSNSVSSIVHAGIGGAGEGSNPNSRRSSVQLTPSASFGAKRQSAQERRNQHRRTFSSDWPSIQKSTLQALGIVAAQAQAQNPSNNSNQNQSAGHTTVP